MKDKIEIFWYRFCTWCKDWVYPAWNLRNMLFNRYDIVKMPKIKCYEYSDVVQRVEYANFELIKFFIEKENPEKHIEWYGEYGHKYGENPNIKILYPELKDKYIMDIIKEIYDFYTIKLVELNNDYNYLLTVWGTYCINFKTIYSDENKAVGQFISDKSNYDLNSPEIQNLNWDLILKYINSKEAFFEDKVLHNAFNELEKNIYEQTQYYLHLIIEVREHLWT